MSAGFVALYAVLSKILLSRSCGAICIPCSPPGAARMLPLRMVARWLLRLHVAVPRLALGFLFFSNIGGFIAGCR